MVQKQSQSWQKDLQKVLFDLQKNLESRIEKLREEDPFSNPDHASDNAAVDTDVREKVGHETIEAEINLLSRKLDSVTRALEKIYKKSYGKCESCKQEIAIERLQFMPEAKYCIDCEKRLVR